MRLLRRAGITGWAVHVPYAGYEIDAAFPLERIAIEVDGWAWHVDPERFVRDRQRQNALVNGAWHILRFTWHDLTARPDEVLAEIGPPSPSGRLDRCFGRRGARMRGRANGRIPDERQGWSVPIDRCRGDRPCLASGP